MRQRGGGPRKTASGRVVFRGLYEAITAGTSGIRASLQRKTVLYELPPKLASVKPVPISNVVAERMF
jgi:hypothetical protein